MDECMCGPHRKEITQPADRKDAESAAQERCTRYLAVGSAIRKAPQPVRDVFQRGRIELERVMMERGLGVVPPSIEGAVDLHRCLLDTVLDDRNADRSCVVWCYRYALENGDAAGAELAGGLLCLSDPLFEAALDARRGGEAGHG